MSKYVLEILDGDRAGEVIDLETRLRIGRKPGNDLVIADEKTSGEHAEIALEGDRYVLRDLGSTNGTMMEGHKVTEVVLTPGDAFQVGRVHLRFRGEGAAGEDLTVHRVDQARLQRARRPRSAAVLALLLLAAGGAAAWQFLGRGAEVENGKGPGRRAPLAVADNRLPDPAGACEDETGWQLRAAGAGFALSGRSHTGRGAFEAVRPPDGEASDFALARLQLPLTVLAGRPQTLAAHLRTAGNALAGVRLRFFSSVEANPFEFRVGTQLESRPEWQRVTCTAAVPPGADRVEVELVAVLPEADSMVWVDDVALTENGQAQAVSLQLDQTGQTLLGAGAGVAVRSTDVEQPAILLGIRPDVAAGSLAGLHQAGLTCLSDVGGRVAAEKTERSFELTFHGVRNLLLEFPAEAQDGLLVRGGQGSFASAPGDATMMGQQVLLGVGRTRCLLSLDAPRNLETRSGGGRYRVRLEAERLELVLNFRSQRQAAQELLRTARSRAATEPGPALDQLRELQRNLPHDSETLRESQALRAELLQALADRLAVLREDLDEAQFFDTRGGFERVVQGIDQAVAAYGEHNLEDAEAVRAAREAAASRLQALDSARTQQARARLEELAKLLADSGQEDLAVLVRGGR